MDAPHEAISPEAFDLTRIIPLLHGENGRLNEALQQLNALESVRNASLDGHNRLHVTYDASAMQLPDVERVLDVAGVKRPATIGWRLKSAWYRFVDGNARTNASTKGEVCCNRPPKPDSSGD